MERKVSVYPFPFGTRVFMHRNGVIREAEYRGMRIKDTGICGNNVDTEHIFWFGSKLGEEKFKVSMPIYKTAEDAAQETNPVQYEVLTMSFSLTEEDLRVTMERDVELSAVAGAVKNQHHKKKI